MHGNSDDNACNYRVDAKLNHSSESLREIVLPASAYDADADRVKALDPGIIISDE